MHYRIWTNVYISAIWWTNMGSRIWTIQHLPKRTLSKYCLVISITMKIGWTLCRKQTSSLAHTKRRKQIESTTLQEHHPAWSGLPRAVEKNNNMKSKVSSCLNKATWLKKISNPEYICDECISIHSFSHSESEEPRICWSHDRSAIYVVIEIWTA